MMLEQQKNLILSKLAFEVVSEKLKETDSEAIREYIYDVNEMGLGIETLIDVLLEDDIPISTNQYDAIVEAANSMGLDRGQHKLRVVD